MTLTNIVGTIKGSGTTALNGKVVVTLQAPVINQGTDPHTVHFAVPQTYVITNGVLNINVEESESSGVSYNLAFYEKVSDDPLEYGMRPFEEIYTVVPAAVGPMQFSGLMPSGVSGSTLDYGTRRLANLLVAEERYLDAIRSSLTRNTGEYNPDVFNRRGDQVTWNGSSFTYTNALVTMGNAPPLTPGNNEWWQLVAAKGPTGTGTSGNDAPYNATSWDGALDAPSRNAVRDLAVTLATTTAMNLRATSANPTLTGNVNIPTAAPGTASTIAASTAFVNTSFLRMTDGTLLGNPTVPTPAPDSNSDRVTNTAWVRTYTLPKIDAALLGAPTAPTQQATDNSTRIATTAYVQGQGWKTPEEFRLLNHTWAGNSVVQGIATFNGQTNFNGNGSFFAGCSFDNERTIHNWGIQSGAGTLASPRANLLLTPHHETVNTSVTFDHKGLGTSVVRGFKRLVSFDRSSTNSAPYIELQPSPGSINGTVLVSFTAQAAPSIGSTTKLFVFSIILGSVGAPCTANIAEAGAAIATAGYSTNVTGSVTTGAGFARLHFTTTGGNTTDGFAAIMDYIVHPQLP